MGDSRKAAYEHYEDIRINSPEYKARAKQAQRYKELLEFANGKPANALTVGELRFLLSLKIPWMADGDTEFAVHDLERLELICRAHWTKNTDPIGADPLG